MKDNTDQYLQMLCQNHVGPSLYHNVPILSAISAGDFVNKVLPLSAPSQNTVFHTFKNRYQDGQLQKELCEEKEWLMEIRRLFQKKVASSRPLLKYRILDLIKNNVDPFLTCE